MAFLPMVQIDFDEKSAIDLSPYVEVCTKVIDINKNFGIKIYATNNMIFVFGRFWTLNDASVESQNYPEIIRFKSNLPAEFDLTRNYYTRIGFANEYLDESNNPTFYKTCDILLNYTYNHIYSNQNFKKNTAHSIVARIDLLPSNFSPSTISNTYES